MCLFKVYYPYFFILILMMHFGRINESTTSCFSAVPVASRTFPIPQYRYLSRPLSAEEVCSYCRASLFARLRVVLFFLMLVEFIGDFEVSHPVWWGVIMGMTHLHVNILVDRRCWGGDSLVGEGQVPAFHSVLQNGGIPGFLKLFLALLLVHVYRIKVIKE